jgi:hypothetical protein
MFPRRCSVNGLDSGARAGWILRFFNAAWLLSSSVGSWVGGGFAFIFFGGFLLLVEIGLGEQRGGWA